MNRYMNRYVAAFLLLVSLDTVSYGQVKLDGPSEAVVGNLNKVAVQIEKGKDLKITLLKNGKQTTADHMVVKELDDSVAVLLFPPTPKKGEPQSWNYTVVAAVNNDGKTYTAFHFTEVNKAAPTPDPVIPVPDPEPKDPKVTALQQDLGAFWATGKDAVSRDKLVKAFEEVKSAVATLKTFGDFETTVVTSVERNLPDRAKLRTVRTRIAAYLVDRTGEDPRAWDAKIASDVCDEINAALRRLQ
jgi:hypothetical protein